MKKYYIYHIPTFIHKDGSIGKIGCSDKPESRVNKQGYNDYQILEEFTCIYLVSDREIQLQKEYDYKVDNIPYWLSIKHRNKGGIKQGNNNRESGQLHEAQKIAWNSTSKPVLVHKLDGTFVGEYKSQIECARQLNLNQTLVNSICNGKIKQTKGYVITKKTHCNIINNFPTF